MNIYISFIKPAIIYLISNNIIKLSYLPKKLRIGLKGTLIFELNREIKFHENRYYKISPMIDETDIIKYYEFEYWENYLNVEKFDRFTNRDLFHFQMIVKLTNIQIGETNFLNFGAGHGGLSHLFYSFKSKVVNIDYDRFLFELNQDDKNWTCYNDLKEIRNVKFNLIYASHSLEHVLDIEYIIQNIFHLLEIGGYLFVEVPNCESNKTLNGGSDFKIHVPHTYYFTRNFFERLPLETIHCEIYNDNNEICQNNILGSSIRYLGRKKA